MTVSTCFDLPGTVGFGQLDEDECVLSLDETICTVQHAFGLNNNPQIQNTVEPQQLLPGSIAWLVEHN